MSTRDRAVGAIVLSFGLAAGIAPPASAQTPRLLGDINRAPLTFSFVQGAALGEAGDTIAYFTFFDPINQSEVWRTDGTIEGTRPFVNLPSLRSSIYGVAGDTIVFEHAGMVLASTGDPGDATVLRTGAVVPNRNSLDSWFQHSRRNGYLFFNPSPATADGGNLTATDGTAAGTTVLFPSQGAANISDIACTPTRTFAIGLGGADIQTVTLLMSEGVPPEPATVVATFTSGSNGAGGPPKWLTAFGERVVFVVNDMQRRSQLWVSDGTPDGTLQLTSFVNTSVTLAAPTPLNDRIAFLGPFSSTGSGPQQWLWFTDGTPAGTVRAEFPHQLLASFPASPPSPDTPRSPIKQLNNGLALIARVPDATPIESLVVGDGTAAGTTRLDLGSATPIQLIGRTARPDGDVVYFIAREGSIYRPWRTDGTQAGTFPLAGAPGTPTFAQNITALAEMDGLFIFGIYEGAPGWKVFATDGSAEGTRQIAGAGLFQLPNASSSPSSFTPFGDGIVFAASEPSSGTERYRAGSTAGTAQPCEESVPGPDSNAAPVFYSLGGRLFSRVTRLITAPNGSTVAADALVVTDSANALGTVLYQANVELSISRLGSMDNTLYFSGPGLQPGENTLWRSDGTPEGTGPVDPSPEQVVHQISPIFPWNGHGYYIGASLDRTGYALFKTDGTAAGTQQLAQMVSAFVSPTITFAATADRLYYNSYTPSIASNRLWTTDGTPEGTRVVDETVTVALTSTSNFAAYNGQIYVAGSRAGATRIWTPNADATALVPLLDAGTDPRNLVVGATAAGDRLYFTTSNATIGNELWLTDGTQAGTRPVIDLWPGPLSSRPGNLRPVPGGLVFAAETGPTGNELFRTDGTPEGTSLLADIFPGPTPSSPGFFTEHRGVLSFSALDPVAGREPFAMRLVPCPADINGDDTVTSADFFDFLTCFFTDGCADADFNADGAGNSQDLFDFLAAFFQPC